MIVVVASGEPGTLVICWANAEAQLKARRPTPINKLRPLWRSALQTEEKAVASNTKTFFPMRISAPSIGTWIS